MSCSVLANDLLFICLSGSDFMTGFLSAITFYGKFTADADMKLCVDIGVSALKTTTCCMIPTDF